MRRIVLLVLLTGLTAAPALAGDVTNLMTSQGVVRNQAGDVVNGTYQLTFKLYSVPTGGNALWSEVQPGVVVENGVYNVLLGTTSPLPGSFFKQNASLWLGITVENEAELPRVRVTSVPYAFNSRSALVAETANDVDCTGCIEPAMLSFDPITQQELDAGDLAVKGIVTATKFVGDGSGLTGITSPKGTCSDGWLVKQITDQGTVVCEKAGKTLSGAIVEGDLDVSGTLSVNGAEVCTSDANCGEELWQLACLADQVPKWDGDMWGCADLADLAPDGLNEVSNDLVWNQFTDNYASTTCPVAVKDNNPTGVTDEILVPDAGEAQKLTVSINITNSDLGTVEVLLYDPDNVEYVLYSKNGPGQQLGTTYPEPTPPKVGDLTKWVGKNPKGTWRLLVKDTGFKDNGFDGQVNSWSVQVQTLSTKKIQVKGNLIVDGDVTAAGALTFSGNATVNGGLKLGTDNAACTEAKRGTLRMMDTVVQVCNGSNWTFLGANATYRWGVFSTYSQWNGCWYANNDPSLFGGVHPSNWTNGNQRAVHMTSDFDQLRTILTRRGPPIGTLKNAVVYSDEWYYYSSTNGKVVVTLFRIRNKTQQDINWKAYWYKTAYGDWSEWAGIAVNGSEVWSSGGSNYNACQNTSHDINIPKNRTSTVIFSSTSGGPDGTRPLFMAFYNNSLVLPAGLEFVDDFDTKPNGWDN